MKSIGFIAGLLSIGMALHSYHARAIQPFENFSTHTAHIKQSLHKANTVILGDSHTAYGIDDSVLPDTIVNMAYPGDTIFEMYARTLYALDYAPSINTIIILADPHMFGQYRDGNVDTRQMLHFVSTEAYCSLKPCSPLYRLQIWLQDHFPLLHGRDRQLVIMAMKRDILRMLGSTVESDIGLNAVTTFTFHDNWERFGQNERENAATKRLKTQLGNKGLSSLMTDTYRDLLQTIQKDNVRIIGMRMPVSNEYLQALENYDGTEYDAFIEDLPFHTFLDYREYFADTSHLFHDQDHLNATGATLLTETLVSDIGL